jgi:sarcosine oxidase
LIDAIVVGLGAVGSAAAYQLARRGASVLGIDRHSPPHAFGSSHGDSRITRRAIGEGVQYNPLVARSNQIWRDIEAQTEDTLLTVTGGLWISSPARKAETHVRDFFENTVAAAQAHDIEHELLNAYEIREMFPQFNVADNEIAYYEPGAGFLRPEVCVRAQLTLARELGAHLQIDETVEAISHAPGQVSVRTNRGEYEARHLILAAGAWLPALLEADLARYFTVTRQVMYWFAVDAPPERYAPGEFPVWIWELQDRNHVIYGFPQIDGPRSGVKVATEQYAEATTAERAIREVSRREVSEMYTKLVAPYLPELDATCLKTAACLYTATPDFHFVIDRHPRMPNVIIASPCSGHGFKHSPAVGEALAQMVLDGRSELDLRFFALDRLGRW